MHIHDTILLAAESSTLRKELRRILEQNYNILEASSEDQLRLLIGQNSAVIAAILLDVKMKSESGSMTLESLAHDGLADMTPIICIINSKSARLEKISLECGAREVILSPFNSFVVRNRVSNIISFFYNKRNLQSVIDEQASAIHKSYEVMVDTLSSLIEYRSIESGQHVLRIRRFTKILLEEMQQACPEYSLTKEGIQAMASASALHDIGKISISDAILNKPGKLTEEEFEIMKTHTVTGSSILENFKDVGDENYLRYAYNICRYHHERWDGSGYPEGLRGDNIPICAQVVGLVDAYDALTTDRVYKKAIPYLEASNMIINGECGVFSPKLIECFKHIRGVFEELARSYADGYSPKSDTISIPLPLPKKAGDDSLQIAIQKYNALLHHFNVTAIEVDAESGIYHLLYDPNLDFAPIRNSKTFSEAMKELANKAVHPDDRHLVTDQLKSYFEGFFSSGLRKSSRNYRIIGSDGIYRSYEATIIRINPVENNEKKVIALWRRLDEKKTANTARLSASGSEFIMPLVCHFDNSLSFEKEPVELLHALGYTENEMPTLDKRGFWDLISPEAMDDIRKQLTNQLTKSVYIDIAVPLLSKIGETVYYLWKAKLEISEKGHECLGGIVCNFDRIKNEHETSVYELALYQTIVERSQDVLFEWDLISDRLLCSKKWKEHFGYDNISEDASVNIPKSSHIHPDDVALFIHKMQELKKPSCDYIETALRFADSEGHYLWSRIRATSICDDAGETVKIVGLISDIDNDLRRSQQLLDKAERDSLTKMLNKEACRSRIEQYLSEKGKKKGGALIIIDLDNFKQVNDKFGHMFGDTVLTGVSEEIIGMFREGDVVARIGGDEFLVFMPEVTKPETVKERSNEIIDIVSSMFNDKISDVKLSCSIGASLAPRHATSYTELFQKADTALYVAKGMGKGRSLIYTADMERPDYASNISKHIDSDERPGIADNSLVEYVFQRLYDTSDIEETVNSVLEILGKQMNVSRVYIFENNSDNTACSNTFEWCNEGVAPEKDNLQNISYETDIPGFEKNFNERGIFYCSDIATLPDDLREIFEPQGVRALLHCAIRNQGVFSGYVGFDECERTRLWTKDQIDQIIFLSQLVSVFILKKRAQERSEILNSDLKKILESQYAWVYVVEPETYKIQFLNGRVSEIAPDARKGEYCYKTLMGYDKPCDECPIRLGGGRGGTCRISNQYLDVDVDATATQIHWSGKEQWLLTCRKVDEKSED